MSSIKNSAITVPILNKSFNMSFRVDIRPTLLMVSTLMFLITWGQTDTKQDSLVRVYNQLEDGIPKVKTLEELFYNNVYNDPKKGEYYARLSESLCERLNNLEGYGVAIFHIGVSLQLQTKLDSAMVYYKKGLKFFEDNEFPGKYATVLGTMADIERRRQNYATALSYLKEAVKAHQDINDQLRAGVSVGDIGNVYYDLGNYKLAFEKTVEALKILDTVQKEPWRKADLKRQIGRIEYARENYPSSILYLQDALRLYEETNDNVWQAYTLNDIANSYYDLDSLDTAINYYNKALVIAEEYELVDTQANVWSNLGGINTHRKNFDLAREQLNKSLDFNQQNQDLQSVLFNYLALSELELKSKNRKEALELANRGIMLSDSIKTPKLKKSFFYQRSEIFREQKKFKKAFDDLSAYVTLNDSLNKVNNAKQIDELKIIYETEQKEKELIIQQKEITLLKERQQKAEIQKWFIIITALGILAFAIAVIYGLRQKMKKNKLIREQLDKNIEFKEKELTTHALHLAHKNEILLDLKKQLKELKSKGTNSYQYQKIINNINLDITNDNNWKQFRSYFEEVHKDFNSKILKSYPEVSNNDLRLMSLLKMNLSSKEIANILNISMEGVKKARYRLRKKLNLSTEESLQELVIEL